MSSPGCPDVGVERRNCLIQRSIRGESEFVEERAVPFFRHIDEAVKGDHFHVGVYVVLIAKIPLTIGSALEVMMNSAALFKRGGKVCEDVAETWNSVVLE